MFKGNISKMLKQAQEMQKQIEEVQNQLSDMVIDAESGGGMVSVKVNGKQEILELNIDPDAMKEDKEMLEDLLAAAVNDAVRKIEQQNQEQMGKLTAGMGLPAGMKLPF